MNELEKSAAINLRRFFRIVLGYEDKFETTSDNCDYFYQEASDLILHGLESDKPFAISRFGHSELRTVLTYLHIHESGLDWKKLFAFAKGEKVEPWWVQNTVRKITHNAGVFPADINVIERFCTLTLDIMPHIDVLGSWLGGEKWIKHRMPNTKFMRFHDFYHFLHQRPWTSALKDKKVLVVHPFERSIQHQYKQKEKIFTGVHQLPDFKLITYKAVQSIAGNKPEGFNNWFEALDKMNSDIAKIDFDIAILGCGAYGMPLSVSIKNDLKKKSIHLGGNVQFLFGIKGSRWENDPVFSPYINSHWVKPLSEETPTGHQTIDSNCYW
jgi:hypothetical protein